MDFATLKSNRKSSFDKLTAAAEKVAGNQSQNNGPDERFWKPTVDTAGNGSAIIRFLPAPSGEDVPFVRYWDHGLRSWWLVHREVTDFYRPRRSCR